MNRYAYVGRPCQLEQEIENLQTQGYCLFSRFTGSEGGRKVKIVQVIVVVVAGN